MKMPLYEPGSWVFTTYFAKLARLLVCRNGSLQGTVSIKPSHIAQQVLNNSTLWLGNLKRHCIPVVASSVICRLA